MNTIKNALLTLCIWSLVSISSVASDSPDSANATSQKNEANDSYNAVKQEIETALDWLAKGDYQKFADSLPPGLAPEPTAKDNRAKLVNLLLDKQKAIEARFGASVDEVAFVREEASGTYWRRIGYLQKHIHGANYWYFLLYRVDDRWCLTNLHFDALETGLADDPKALFDREGGAFLLADAFAEKMAMDSALDAYAIYKIHGGLARDEADFKKADLILKLETLNSNPALMKYELLKTETVGEDAIRYHYMIPRRKNSIHLQVTLYRAEKDWQFYGWQVTSDGPKVYTALSPTPFTQEIR